LGAIDLLKSQLHIQIQGPKDAPIAQTLGQVDHAVHRLESLMTKFRIYLELEELVNRPGNLRSENLQAQSLQTTGQPPGQPAEQAMGQLEENLRFSYAIGIAKARAYHHKRVNDLILDMVEAPITLSAKYLSILLDELVDNALKFSNPGTTVTVTSQASGNRMDIWIRDSGRGMTAEQINQVGAFMQFERPTYEQQGMGMGLKIAAKIVELAGGIFAIRQNEPQGTTVQLSLPIPGLNKVG
jgi:signal transduction histidine kinase